MKEKKKGAFRLTLLILWPASIMFLGKWIYAGIIFPVIWVYDALTLRTLFERRWGKKQSFRV